MVESRAFAESLAEPFTGGLGEARGEDEETAEDQHVLSSADGRVPGRLYLPGGTAAAACAPADIVLSLFTSQASYDQRARPRFNVYAVSTAAAGCTLTYGSGAVQVIVTSQGHVVWNSAACDPPAAKPVRFTLGVPQLLTVTWNRKAASPAGCAGSLPAGFTGTLRAVVMSHGQSSPVRAFKIAR